MFAFQLALVVMAPTSGLNDAGAAYQEPTAFEADNHCMSALFCFGDLHMLIFSLCERGSSVGYNNLVVDPLNFGIMKRTGYPVVFDVTHSLQIPGGRSVSAGGRRQAVFELMLAGMSQGIGGLFLESHPNPGEAKCDGPCALPLDKLEAFLSQAKAIDDLVKGLDSVKIE